MRGGVVLVLIYNHYHLSVMSSLLTSKSSHRPLTRKTIAPRNRRQNSCLTIQSSMPIFMRDEGCSSDSDSKEPFALPLGSTCDWRDRRNEDFYLENLSTRFKESRIQMENDRLRAENEELRREIAEMRETVFGKNSEETKCFLQAQSTISVDTHTLPETSLSMLSLEIDVFKGLCTQLRQENYQLKQLCKYKEIESDTLRRRLSLPTEAPPKLCSLNTRKQNLEKRQLRTRNKWLQNLVLSLTNRLNRLDSHCEQELFCLSPRG